jgi:hypothetical protein
MNFKKTFRLIALSACTLLLNAAVVRAQDSPSLYGQVTMQLVSKSALPSNISYKGKFVKAMQYQDNTGKYIALATQAGVQPQEDVEFKQVHLYTYVYQLKDNAKPVLMWQLHDSVTDCNLDLMATFLPATLGITDVDNNGMAEVWVAYRLGCSGDISPNELKIIAHEGATKYGLRGIGKINVGNITQDDGGVITSNDFKNAPVSFRQYAGKLWDKYLLEVIQ